MHWGDLNLIWILSDLWINFLTFKIGELCFLLIEIDRKDHLNSIFLLLFWQSFLMSLCTNYNKFYKKVPLCWFDHFLYSRAEICQFFRWFFGKFKSKRHSEINWPLAEFHFRSLFMICSPDDLIWTSERFWAHCVLYASPCKQCRLGHAVNWIILIFCYIVHETS